MSQHTALPGTGAEAGAELPDLLRRAARIPALRAKYPPLPATGPVRLTDLPPLTRQELAQATGEVLASGTQAAASLVWADGGTVGAPALSLLPDDMFAERVRDAWSPLGPSDVLVNLHSCERLRPDHHFFNRFAAASGAACLPLGPLPDGAQDAWLDFFARTGVTALSAPPETVARLAGAAGAGRPLPWLRTLLLGGTLHDTTSDALLADRFPYTRVWRLYGSPATGVVARHGPHCLSGVYHPLPHQLVEVVEGQLLVTTLDARRDPPLIRYATQERGEYAYCVCGAEGPAVRLSGPADPYFRLHGRAVSARELVDSALATGEATAAQVAVSRGQRVRLRVVLAPGVPDDHYTHDWIRYQVLESRLGLPSFVLDQPEVFDVVAVDRLDGAPLLTAEEF
ncbi:hypothetical protein [Streptomyces lavendulae]|uniref:hypothetical protein n=1 Tax=Streptomyces lavendulae TaxID=1914 RepID=UPI0025543CA3|nr:hypothetical protein [Streptomyces lavendulae]